MKDGIDLSVIIPIYNVEKYIAKCIDSLLKQDNDRIQYIFIDDGSQDNSYKIVSKYAQNNPSFIVIRQENKGLGGARNEGMKHAKGKYVLFVDSDDYIEPNSLEKLVDIALLNSVDILQAKCKLIYEDGKVEYNETKMDEEIIEDGKYWLRNNHIDLAACFCLYSSKMLQDNDLRFMEGVYHEDMDFKIRAVYYAKRMMEVDNSFYNYLMRESSISHEKSLRRCEDYFRVSHSLSNWAKDNVDDNTYEEFFRNYFGFLYSHMVNICVIENISMKEFLSDDDRRQEIFYFLKNSKSKKYWMGYILLRFRLYKLYSSLYLTVISIFH